VLLNILIVDDHALFREGLKLVLGQMESDVTVIESLNCDHAMQYASENSVLDLVLLDLNMPGIDGFDGLDLFICRFPALPVVIPSASNLRTDVQLALDKGAVGFIHKDIAATVLLNALRMILSGGIYVPPHLTQLKQSDDADNTLQALTPRQRQVFILLAVGQSNRLIAANMGLSEATVKMHVTAIFKHLGVSNRTQAALEAEKLGLPSG
jgi:DNA-binding NarL/FixJ family response regulator